VGRHGIRCNSVLPGTILTDINKDDLADPEKRTREDLRAALSTLTQFQKYVNVTLGLNLREAIQVSDALGLPRPGNPEAAIETMAAGIRKNLQIGTVVIHPRGGAAAATPEESASFSGPFVTQPKISTGAGDHFNAGFMIGQMLGLNLIEALCAGTATSGYYVRTAASPTSAQLAEFILHLPAPQN
jgi:sugar/nucleoside kinase (ribokinase family)